MAGWSQSFFLQALGWATLNSFWQMGLLWCAYLLANHLLKLSAHQKYLFSVGSVALGFAWFVFSFFSFEKTNGLFAPLVQTTVKTTYLQMFLISASVTYLILLIFPAYRLLKNWQFVQKIKKQGLQKAALPCRLFVQKITAQLNLKNKVSVFVSDLVSSPVTVGYLKPVILLPIAVLNQLTPAQVEAILLHEISHIKRADYLLNLLISIISTVLYFNPFVKLFVQQIDAERENCCDEMVLQFGYDKVAYCSALLTLEKTAGVRRSLALGVTGQKNLLTRIEKIVGMEKKKRYSFAQLLPAFAAIICLLAFNSVLILQDASRPAQLPLTASTAFNPLYLIESGYAQKAEINAPLLLLQQNTEVAAAEIKTEAPVAAAPVAQRPPVENNAPALDIVTTAPVSVLNLTPVALDEVDVKLSPDQKIQVSTTIATTQEILTTLQWQEVESSMADALSDYEKQMVKDAYNQELASVNWQNIEKNLKVNYDKIDWHSVNADLGKALSQIELEKLEKQHELVLQQLQKTEKEISTPSTNTCVAIPDASLREIRKAQAEVKRNLQEIRSAKEKRIIRL